MDTATPRTIDAYPTLYRTFAWDVPDPFNIAHVCCARWADDAQRIALMREGHDGRIETLTYAALHRHACALAHALTDRGVGRGDVVALAMPQRFEVPIALMAVAMIGAVAMPLSVLFGPEALAYRLRDGRAKAIVVDAQRRDDVLALLEAGAAVQCVVDVDATMSNAKAVAWPALIDAGLDRGAFAPARTRALDPALLIYTSGTTGNPKGATLPHAAMIGNLPGFVASQNWFPCDGDVFWSPADWAWTGGLWDALLPTLYFGRPIVAGDARADGRFSAERAFALMERFGVTNTFLFPTALKAMMKSVPHPRERYALKLRAIMSAGEPVGDTVYRYCEDRLGVRVNEMFGQTEVNYIVGNSDRWPARPGSMGRPYPGHRVAVIDDAGHPCAPDEVGDVAIHREWITEDGRAQRDPIFFLGYWGNDAATRDKFTGDWCRTGDLARMDRDGYLWYQGRADDVFKSAGYRIGPAEIENCLLQHPAVAICAVVGKPDPHRTNIVQAFVVLTATFAPSDALTRELQDFVRTRLAAYEVPKEIVFVTSLPMTTTGKIQRRLLRTPAAG